MYILGQFFGILVAVSCAVAPFFKKKWQILAILLGGNICAALNFLILKGVGPAVIINILASVHIVVDFIHEKTRKATSLAEKIVFLVLYLACGFIGFKGAADLLPVAAAVFFMLSVFQNKAQSVRVCITLNATMWIIYDIIIGSSAILAQLIAIASNISSYIKYRKEC